MTSRAPASATPTPTVFTPLVEGGPEHSRGPSPEVREALRRDQVDMQREVILAQRWVRYLALVFVIGVAALLSRSVAQPAMVPLVSIALGYAACVFLTGWLVRRVPALPAGALLPGLLVTADLLMVGAVVYLTGVPLVATRFLIVALLFVPLAVFYFGVSLGVYAALLACGIYLAVAEFLPPYNPGPRPVSSAINAALFTMVAAVLIAIFGSFRTRMNQLRLFCKLVEDGDLGAAADLARPRLPDDLTLLARSFEAMRNGLAEQIGTDPLTGCLNRRALETRLKSDWRHAKRRNTQIAVVAIDLDHFKQINDTRGHPVGDTVLQQLAGIMKATARDTDAVARFGGDEFVILLPDTGWQGALTFAERLRRRVDDYTFGPPGSAMTLTVSVGVALARGTDQIAPEELLKEADRSLYKAKQQGRNRVFA